MTRDNAGFAVEAPVAPARDQVTGDNQLNLVAQVSSGPSGAFNKFTSYAPDAFFAALGTENFFKVFKQPRMPFAHGTPDTVIKEGDEQGTQIWHKQVHGHNEVVQMRLATGPVYAINWDKNGQIKQLSGPDGRFDRRETDQWTQKGIGDINKVKARFDGTIDAPALELGIIKLQGKDGSRVINGNGFVAETAKSDSGDQDLLQSITNSKGRKVEFNYLAGELNSIQLSDSTASKFVLVRDPQTDKWYQTVPNAPNAMFELPYKVRVSDNSTVSIENTDTGTTTVFNTTGIRTIKGSKTPAAVSAKPENG